MEKEETIQERLGKAILSLQDEWLLIMEIDLRTEEYLLLSNDMQELGIKIEETGNFRKLTQNMEQLIAEEYQSGWSDFCNLKHLREELRERSRAEYEYVVVAGENTWRRDFFQVMEREDGDPVRVAWFHVNIDRKKAEELKQRQLIQEAHMLSEQAYAVKNMYIDRISKELQIPMNVIVGNAAIARTFSTNSERVEECLGEISTSAKSMFQMVRHIVKMDAIEEGNTVIHKEDVSILELWKTTMDMLLPAFRMHRHTLDTSQLQLTHNYVHSDAMMLRQIVLNLLQNAINYTPAGGNIAVSLKETPVDDRHGLYEFCVEDNGVGMTEEFRKVMFEPFKREYSIRVGHVDGLGLGLVIVRNLVRMLDGEIRVDSVCGRGTKITVLLKLAYGTDTKPQQSPERRNELNFQQDYSGKRVLLVDDNSITAGVEQQMLETLGFEVEYALNGEDAVRMFSDSSEGYYDLILMDLGLPGIDGYAATMGIRQLGREDGKNIPVIALTYRRYLNVENLNPQDLKYRLSKPIAMHDLLEVLRRIFGEETKDM